VKLTISKHVMPLKFDSPNVDAVHSVFWTTDGTDQRTTTDTRFSQRC